MGLFLRQDGLRSELQTKVASDLRERLKDRAEDLGDPRETPELGDSHQTGPRGIIIVLSILAVLVIGLWFIAQ